MSENEDTPSSMEEEFDEIRSEELSTDYGTFVLHVLAKMKESSHLNPSNVGEYGWGSPGASTSLTAATAAFSSASSSRYPYGSTSSVPSSSSTGNGIDQHLLRQCIGLSSSHLLADTTTRAVAGEGVDKWLTGFNRLVDVVVALHNRGELELETLNATSKACSECWTVAGAWRGMEGGREGVRMVAARLKQLLDENQKTYKGRPVYSP